MPSSLLIPRPRYDAVLDSSIDSPAIKVLSGVRRCGKSTLLLMLAQRLRAKGVPPQNILYRKLDSFDTPLAPDAAWLEGQILEALSQRDPAQPFFLFLDEVQEVAGWEKVLRRAHTERVASIFLTGSNAFLLSSDLATYLSGRYVEIPVFPLSFEEYLAFSGATGNEQSAEALLARYIRYGGMPSLFEMGAFDQDRIYRELTAIHDTVILNDVARRFELRDADLLEKLVRYVYATSGNLFSSRKIADALTSAGRKTNVTTVDAYLNALERAFLLMPCEQVGIGGKQVLRPLRKLYAPDTGLRNREIGFATRDLGFQLESVVFCELVRRGYDVQIGANKTGEIDFVATRRDEKLYIQVSDTITSEETLKREEASLLSINNAFPKIILTRDALTWGITPEGIRIQGFAEWLLENE